MRWKKMRRPRQRQLRLFKAQCYLYLCLRPKSGLTGFQFDPLGRSGTQFPFTSFG